MDRSKSLTQAALVLNRLPKKQAAAVLSRLEPEDMKRVIDAISKLDKSSADEIWAALTRFELEATRLIAVEEALSGDDGKDFSLVDTEKQSTFPVEGLAEDENPFKFLIDTHPSVRKRLICDEHPKHIAMVISMLPPEMASDCVGAMEPTLRTSVFRRLCDVDVLDETEVAELSFALKLRMKKLLSSWYSTSVGMNVAAELLSCSDSATQEVLLEHMSQADPDLAVRLKRTVFRIEKLETLSKDEIKTILKHVDTACWAPALKNAPLSLHKKILGSMAQQPAKMLQYEIEEIGQVSPLVQQKSEKLIVTEVLRLAREGKIDLRKNGPRGAIPPGAPVENSVSQLAATSLIS